MHGKLKFRQTKWKSSICFSCHGWVWKWHLTSQGWNLWSKQMEVSNLCSKFTTFLTLNSLPLKHCLEITKFTLLIFSSSLNMWIIWSTLLILFRVLYLWLVVSWIKGTLNTWSTLSVMKYLSLLLPHEFGINWTRCGASRKHSNKGDI